jgi:hypothetical protein
MTSVQQVEQTVRIARELHREVATGAQAREIYKIGEQYRDAEDTLNAIGYAPMNPVRTWSHDLNIATNSFKYVKLGGGFGPGWHFAWMPDLVIAAVTGRLVSARW